MGEDVLVSPSEPNRRSDAVPRTYPSIAWNGEAYGVAWSTEKRLAFRRVSSTGELLGDELDLTPEGLTSFWQTRVAAPTRGQWIVAFECCLSRTFPYACRLTDDQVLTPLYRFVIERISLLEALEVSTDRVAVGWLYHYEPNNSTGLQWTLRTPDLLPLREEDFTVDATEPWTVWTVGRFVMAGAPNAFAGAWGSKRNAAPELRGHMSFVVYDTEGRVQCGPVELSQLSDEGASLLVPSRLVAKQNGYLLGFRRYFGDPWNAPSTAELVELSSDCQLERHAKVADSTTGHQFELARTRSGHTLLIWEDGGTFTQRVIASRRPNCE